MDKQRILKIGNPLLALAFVFQAASGIALQCVSGDLNETIADAHGVCGYVLIALAALHVWLNWGWIKSNFLKRKA